MFLERLNATVSGARVCDSVGSLAKCRRKDPGQASTDSTNCQGLQKLVLPKGSNSFQDHEVEKFAGGHFLAEPFP
jgi:hypothetical protein